MSLNGYLNQIASAAIVRDEEREAIVRSVDAIQQRISSYFGNDVHEQKIFGSFERKTMLPRSMDEKSDVDLMIVFKNDGKKPQTYIERLVRFAEQTYSRSEIARSHPTAALNLSHIRFELVPATNSLWNGLRIPAPKSDWNKWMPTEPFEFSEKLREKNKRNDGLIRPLIRAMKYWNVLNDRPFTSYELEQRIADQGYWKIDRLLFGTEWNLWRYFRTFVRCLSSDNIWGAKGKRENAICELLDALEDMHRLEKNGDSLNADSQFRQMIPEPYC